MSDTALGGWRFNGTGLRLTRVRGGPLAGEALGPDLLERLAACWAWTDARVKSTWGALPHALNHGYLHRDHAGLTPGGGVVLFDLEKARFAPRLRDLANSAYFAGYRGNDERLDPPRIIHYLRAYHQTAPLSADERAAVMPWLMRCFLHDLKAMPQNEAAAAAIRRHATITLEAWRNRDNIDRAIGRYLA